MLLSSLGDMANAPGVGSGQSFVRGGAHMKNPLESLPWTIAFGVILTVILVIIVNVTSA